MKNCFDPRKLMGLAPEVVIEEGHATRKSTMAKGG